VFTVGRRTGNREHPRVRPEATGIILVQREVQELAGPESRKPAFRHQFHGVDVVTVVGNLTYLAMDLLGSWHRVVADVAGGGKAPRMAGGGCGTWPKQQMANVDENPSATPELVDGCGQRRRNLG